MFPDSNPQTAKRRPALVVQANQLGTGLAQTLIAMVTSNALRVGHPSRVHLKLGSSDAAGTGLKTDSVVMTDNLATVLDSEIDG